MRAHQKCSADLDIDGIVGVDDPPFLLSQVGRTECSVSEGANNVSDSRRALKSGSRRDLNADGAVNVSDLLMLLAACGQDASSDTNGDGAADVSDLLARLAAYDGAHHMELGYLEHPHHPTSPHSELAPSICRAHPYGSSSGSFFATK